MTLHKIKLWHASAIQRKNILKHQHVTANFNKEAKKWISASALQSIISYTHDISTPELTLHKINLKWRRVVIPLLQQRICLSSPQLLCIFPITFLLFFKTIIPPSCFPVLDLENTDKHDVLVPLSQRHLACSPLQARDPSHYWWSWGRLSWGSVEAKDFQMLRKFATLSC